MKRNCERKLNIVLIAKQQKLRSSPIHTITDSVTQIIFFSFSSDVWVFLYIRCVGEGRKERKLEQFSQNHPAVISIFVPIKLLTRVDLFMCVFSQFTANLIYEHLICCQPWIVESTNLSEISMLLKSKFTVYHKNNKFSN